MTHRDPVVKWLENIRSIFLNKKSCLEFGSNGTLEFKDFFNNVGIGWFDLTGRIEDFKTEEKFDIIFACHVFEHIERPIDALRNIRSILNKGGYLILATPLPSYDQILTGSDFDHIFVLNEWQLEKILGFTGFKVIRIERTGEHTRGDSIISIATW